MLADKKGDWDMVNHETGVSISLACKDMTEAKAREAGKAKVEKAGIAVAMVPLDAGTGQAVLCYPTSTGVRARPLVKAPAKTKTKAKTKAPAKFNAVAEDEKALVRAAINVGLHRAHEILFEIREKFRV